MCRSHFCGLSIAQVLVDGKDVKEMKLRSLRAKIGLVSQEPVLFSATIAENIAYGRPEATREEIKAAAEAANAASFIEQLPEGFDSQVTTKAFRYIFSGVMYLEYSLRIQ